MFTHYYKASTDSANLVTHQINCPNYGLLLCYVFTAVRYLVKPDAYKQCVPPIKLAEVIVLMLKVDFIFDAAA